MAISFAELNALLAQFWWPFFRIGAAMLAMPFFGDALIPIWVRALLALAISFIAAPLMPAMPTTDLLSLSALMLAFEQAIWGLLFGLIIHFLFSIMTLLGQIISLQMGLGMAMMNDPVNGVSVAILGRMFLLFSTLLFLALDGHLLVIDILVQSFTSWPVGSGLAVSSVKQILALFGWMFSSALAIALPAIVSMLLANISFGVMNRAAPSLNVYALGFPMTMLLGLFSVLISVSGVPARYVELVHYSLDQLQLYISGGAWVSHRHKIKLKKPLRRKSAKRESKVRSHAPKTSLPPRFLLRLWFSFISKLMQFGRR